MTAAKSPSRALVCYDMFGLIPPPTEADGDDVHARYQQITEGKSAGLGGEEYYGYREDLRGEVEASFARLGHPIGANNVTLVQGLFQDTIPTDDDTPVALAHLDGDWYESTKVCLDRIAPRVVSGGRLVIDDYYAWSGCKIAIDEFLAVSTEWSIERHSRVHLVRS
jgi:hypothetical protein